MFAIDFVAGFLLRRNARHISATLRAFCYCQPVFDGPGGVGVAQSVHTEPLAPSLITELIQVGIIGAVLVRHTRAEVDENKVFHIEGPVRKFCVKGDKL